MSSAVAPHPLSPKRTLRRDDLLSDRTKSDLTEDELAGIGSFLLGAGLDTTANMLGLGVFARLQHPDQPPCDAPTPV